jgi:GT2 family glycosyltransferase
MAAAERFHSQTDQRGPLKYLWLLDDDAEIHPDALRSLVGVADGDPNVGLVGARSVDLEDRKTTLETTVHFCRDTGDYFDHAPATHPRHSAFEQWAKEVGGTRGDRAYSGLIETDVAAACCLLARWDAVAKLGFWDGRFFIYEDDAEWCLRFQNAGYKVICNLDAVAYHTTWHRKFTSRLAAMRLYYSNRNRLWLLQKILKGDERKRVMTAWFARLLNHAKFCATHRMMMHAELTRRAVHDALTGRDGKLDLELPVYEPIESVLHRAGAFHPGATIAVVCDHPDYPRAAAGLRDRLNAIALTDSSKRTPRIIELIRNDIPESLQPAPSGVERIVYSTRTRSKIRRQLALLADPPAAAVVFDHHCDFPLARCDWTIHIDLREPDKANLERDTIVDRLAFLRAWRQDRMSADRFLADLRDYVAPNRFG